jgi:hypothetical protein
MGRICKLAVPGQFSPSAAAAGLCLHFASVSRVIKFDAQEYRSGNKSVVLRNVQRELTAYYKCEVSGDQPTFHTDVKSALMLVVGELNLFDFSN